MAQTRCYSGNSSYSSDIRYSWDGKYLYRGNSSYTSDILMTFDGAVPLPILMLML